MGLKSNDICAMIAEMKNIDVSIISEKMRLSKDLGIDSVELIDLLLGIEENSGIEFEGEDLDLGNYRTVESLLSFLSRKKILTDDDQC